MGIAMVTSAAPASAASDGAPVTTVSLTFTGGYRGQQVAAAILNRHGMAGTFYVSSHYVGMADYMSVRDLRAIARSRSEIGGGTVSHHDLATMSAATVRVEVCNDRAALRAWGFPATSFAYPYGSWTYDGQLAAKSCGYNSARGLARLRVSATHCGGCPTSEGVPPLDVYDIRTTSPGSSIAELERAVERAEHAGGGWVPLALSHVCVCPEKGRAAITPAELERLVTWLGRRSPTTEVRTVDQVVGGPVRAAVAVAVPSRSATPRTAGAAPPSRRAAGAPGGVGLNPGPNPPPRPG